MGPLKSIFMGARITNIEFGQDGTSTDSQIVTIAFTGAKCGRRFAETH